MLSAGRAGQASQVAHESFGVPPGSAQSPSCLSRWQTDPASTSWAFASPGCPAVLGMAFPSAMAHRAREIAAPRCARRHTLSPDTRGRWRTPECLPGVDRTPCIRRVQRACARCSYASPLSRDTTHPRGYHLLPQRDTRRWPPNVPFPTAGPGVRRSPPTPFPTRNPMSLQGR